MQASCVKWRAKNASILCEVACQKGNEGCQGYNFEERQIGNPRRVSCMRGKDVQVRKGSRLIDAQIA